MTFIYLREGTSRLKTYSALVKGTKSVIRIDVEVSDPKTLGFMLEDLADIEREQRLSVEMARQAAKAQNRKKAQQLAIAAPLLQIPHFKGDE